MTARLQEVEKKAHTNGKLHKIGEIYDFSGI